MWTFMAADSSYHLLLSNYINNVQRAYYECVHHRVNNAFAEAIIATLIIVLYLHYKLTFWTRHGVANNLASLINRIRKPVHVADNEAYNCGKVVGIYEGLRPSLLVGDACMIRQLLIKDFHKFISHQCENDSGPNHVGANFLFALKHKAWMRVRAMILPSFSEEQVRTLQNLIQESLDFLIHNMEVISINGYPIDVEKYFGAFSLDLIASCAFGTKVNSLQNPENEIVKNMKLVINQRRPLASVIKFLFPTLSKSLNIKPYDYGALNYLKGVMTEIIRKRREEDNQDGSHNQRHDFIKLLLETSSEMGSLSDDEIVDQCLLFIITGYDTTSAALTSIAYCLATNPECQERLLNEVDLINLDDQDVETQLQELDYLNAFIFEVLRMYPPVPRIERKAMVDCMLGDIFISKETLIIVPVYAIHHDPDNFQTPERFWPERFLENKHGHGVYMPFAAGPRNCIGSRFAIFVIKLSLVSILQRFRFSLCPETQLPIEFKTGRSICSPKSLILNVLKR